MANRLTGEKSPYLIQHGSNPVDWYPWCEEAFRRAKAEDKPVFLSIGYSTCHWCHVMAQESFEDPQVARLLNRWFISIKVDREERPDIDAVYMSVCQAMTGSGGWPLTIFMTPQQKPFFAGTYFPRESAYGNYGLTDLLERVAALWESDREGLLRTGEQITKAMNRPRIHDGKAPDRRMVERAYSQLAGGFDPEWGGFGRAPKFPTPHNLLFLMAYGEAAKEAQALRMAELTLERMGEGGIFDHIGGGFSRYSTDERWLVPHFEKMLYDNALLLMAYGRAYQETKRALFSDVAHRTAGYLLRELRNQDGSFCCGQDADSDGVEGKYYLLSPEEVKNVLGAEDGAEFCRLYHITDAGNFAGKSIPNRIGSAGGSWNRYDPRLGKLYDYRRRRTKLAKDDKVLLAWNAWAIIALVRAGTIFAEDDYRNAAVGIYDFVESKMTDANGRLYLRYRDGEAAYPGQLEDYAVYALALTELYRGTWDVRYLQAAVHRARQMLELFADTETGGCFMTSRDDETLIARPKETYDGAMPSGNSAAAMVLQTLSLLTGEQVWREAADRQLRFLAGELGEFPSSGCFGVLAAMKALYPHRELVCAVGDGVPDELTAYLKEHPAEELYVLLKTKENAQRLGECAPFTRDYPIPEQGALYYLCENGSCKAPVRNLSQLGY